MNIIRKTYIDLETGEIIKLKKYELENYEIQLIKTIKKRVANNLEIEYIYKIRKTRQTRIIWE